MSEISFENCEWEIGRVPREFPSELESSHRAGILRGRGRKGREGSGWTTSYTKSPVPGADDFGEKGLAGSWLESGESGKAVFPKIQATSPLRAPRASSRAIGVPGCQA